MKDSPLFHYDDQGRRVDEPLRRRWDSFAVGAVVVFLFALLVLVAAIS